MKDGMVWSAVMTRRLLYIEYGIFFQNIFDQVNSEYSKFDRP